MLPVLLCLLHLGPCPHDTKPPPAPVCACEAGPRGPQGPPGTAAADVLLSTVVTVPPWTCSDYPLPRVPRAFLCEVVVLADRG